MAVLRAREIRPYGEIWAPYYTLHKILDGLNQAYLLTGNEEALQVAEGIGRWVHSRLSKCTNDQLAKMWAIYIGGEYGGMNDVLVELYSASTADDRDLFLEAAKFFDMNSLIDSCAAGEDALTDKHANQHIPQFVGYAKLYAVTGEERYLKAVQGFFDMVVPGRMYPHGGTGEGELWGPPDTVAGDIGARNAESCAAYNMVKVAWQLFLLTGEQRYVDYCERTVLNHLLGGHRDQDSTESPENLYMFPVHAGAVKEYGDGNIGTCCGGTGLESPMRYQETAFAHSADGSALLVNLYMPSTVTWEEKGLVLTESTDYPRGDSTTLTFKKAPSGTFTLSMRIPEWLTQQATATVNGESAGTAEAGEQLDLTRKWRDGDEVVLTIPLTTWIEPAPDRPTLQTLHLGPTVLAVKGETSKFPRLSLYSSFDLTGSVDGALSWDGDTPVLGDHELDPLYAGHDIAYSTYFEREEAKVAFGGRDSGVVNVKGTDGDTFLDEVWQEAPFVDRQAFLERVRAVSEQYQASGALTPRDRQRILLTASQARMEK